MPEDNQSEGDAQEANNNDRNPLRAAKLLFARLPIGLRRIVAGALFCFALIVAIAVLHPSLNERWKFGVDMTLNLLILLVIAVQAYIYSGQWESMQKQLDAIKNQSRTMRGTWQVIRRQTTVLEDQARLAQTTLHTSHRAYVGLKSHPRLKEMTVDLPPVIELEFINTGRTAAKNCRLTFDYWFGGRSRYEKNGFTIAAGTSKVVSCKWHSQVFDESYIPQIKNNQFEFFFDGKLLYQDVWDADQEPVSFSYVCDGRNLREVYEDDEDTKQPDFVVELEGEAYSSDVNFPEDDLPEP